MHLDMTQPPRATSLPCVCMSFDSILRRSDFQALVQSTTQYQPAHQHQRAPFTNIQMNQPNAHSSNLNNGPTPFRASMKDNGNHRPHPLNDQTSNIGMNSAPFAVNEHQTAAHSLLHQRSTRSTGSVSGGDSPRLTSPNILGNSSGGQNSFRTGGLQQLTSTFGKAPATPRHSHHSSGSSTLLNSARKHHGGAGEGLGNNSKRPQAMFPSAGSMGTPRPAGSFWL